MLRALVGKAAKLAESADPLTESAADELYQRLSAETLPEGFTLLSKPVISLAKVTTSQDRGLDITASLEVNRDLSFRTFYKHSRLDNSFFAHCLAKRADDAGSNLTAKKAINIAKLLDSYKFHTPVSQQFHTF